MGLIVAVLAHLAMIVIEEMVVVAIVIRVIVSIPLIIIKVMVMKKTILR
jgi:hypothetical protein